MRRLPVFFLLDLSESMIGPNLQQLEDGLGAIISSLRRDPHALETVVVSVIGFAGISRTLAPLSELASFYPPQLPVGGGTSLGSALTHLMSEIDKGIVKANSNQKGDWKPIVFLMTDGHPTDDPTSAIDRWNRDYRRRAHIVAISIGGGADLGLLSELSEDVLVLSATDPDSFKTFIQWVTQSIKAQSQSVGAGKDDAVELARPNGGLEKIDLDKRPPSRGKKVDERFAIFAAKCQTNKLPYLIKYERMPLADMSDSKLARQLELYKFGLSGVYPVKNSYFEYCGPEQKATEIRSSELMGQPNCPHCGANYGLAVCGCGKVHCISGEGEQTCPWCGQRGTYASGGEDGFDIGRGQG